jgi:hypothetical protein
MTKYFTRTKEKKMIYRVCPTLDLCKDVEANSPEEAREIVVNEFMRFVRWSSLYKNGYSDLNADFTYITDKWEKDEGENARKYFYAKIETNRLNWFRRLKNTSINLSSLKRKLKKIKENGFYRVWSVQ